MRYCDHEFHTHSLIVDIEENFSIIVCIFCGQVRHIYADGRVLIIKEDGEVIKEYANTSNPNNQTARN